MLIAALLFAPGQSSLTLIQSFACFLALSFRTLATLIFMSFVASVMPPGKRFTLKLYQV